MGAQYFHLRLLSCCRRRAGRPSGVGGPQGLAGSHPPSVGLSGVGD